MDVKEAKRKCKWFVTGDMFYGHVLHTAMAVVLSELEKKDLIINEMAECIGRDIRCVRPEIECNKMTHDCRECVKEYFTKKCEGK